MASAAITTTITCATIESSTTEALITKDTAVPTLEGYLRNAGPADVWCKASYTNTGAATVVTSGAQAQLQFPLPAGASFPWKADVKSVAHVTASGLATLAWYPAPVSMARG